MTTLTNKPLLDYWYIMDLRNLLSPELYPVYFTSKRAAFRAIKTHVLKRTWYKYSVVKGDKLTDYKYTYNLTLGNMGKFCKYNYPPGLETPQQRKSYRTLLRRRLRRMGMLTLTQSKKTIDKKPGVTKLIKNTQKVAMSPNTDAGVFQIERKPPNYFYLKLKQMESHKAKVLFEVEVIRFNIKTGEFKELLLQIKKKDIIIPYLKTQLWEKAKNSKHGKAFLEYCRAKNYR